MCPGFTFDSQLFSEMQIKLTGLVLIMTSVDTFWILDDLFYLLTVDAPHQFVLRSSGISFRLQLSVVLGFQWGDCSHFQFYTLISFTPCFQRMWKFCLLSGVVFWQVMNRQLFICSSKLSGHKVYHRLNLTWFLISHRDFGGHQDHIKPTDSGNERACIRYVVIILL